MLSIINAMRDYTRLFQSSLTGSNPFELKISPHFEYSDLVTFAQNKKTPIYNWFYYKEGFSRDFVWDTLKELKVEKGSVVLDPFCGTGTTLLAAKQAGYNSVGFDILPLGVFVSRVKLEDDYNLQELERESKRITHLKFEKPSTRLVDIRFLDMKRVMSQYARDDICFFRERIMEVDDEKTRNFLLLGLISVVSQAANVMKDGGVLRVVKKRHLPPVRHLLRNKLKRMIKDLKKANVNENVSWKADVGDARSLSLDDETVDIALTSPPYLNFVDYTKVYALELSLLVSSPKEIEGLRRRSLRSHVSAEYEMKEDSTLIEKNIPRIASTAGVKVPEIVNGYLMDLYLSLAETARTLKKGGSIVYVLGNAALPDLTVDVDLILAEMGGKLGLRVEDIWACNVRWAGVHGIGKERPVRESAVILKK
ncbi:MAG: DNA methyltransferase [Candidatus Altiarchaeota archaeon]